MSDLRETNRRGLQLDVISTLLIAAISIVVGLVLYFFSSQGAELPPAVPLAMFVPRILLGAFVVFVIAYLWEQRRRLRRQVTDAIAQTDAARSDLDKAVRYLGFSHQAASRLGAEGVEEALPVVLKDASELFHADAAAVLGQEDEHAFVGDGVPAGEAERALTHAALVATGRGAPLHIQALGTEAGQAIAVPLRVQGDLRYVLAMWKRGEGFEPDELEALGLLGRMIELAIEREESLGDAQEQLEGTLRVLQYLVADKRPDYSRHAVGVADLASAIGQKLGVKPELRKDLRLAGLVHDVGMIGLRDDMGDAGRPLTEEEWLTIRQHPRVGAEIAEAANFDQSVQGAVAAHHERMDGTGYPLGLRGSQIPMEARIIAVCEVYDSMMHRSYQSSKPPLEDAITELRSGAGRLYDADVVGALDSLLEESGVAETLSSEPEKDAFVEVTLNPLEGTIDAPAPGF